MGRILIHFRYLGPLITISPDDFLNAAGLQGEINRQELASFFGIKPADLNQDLVRKYTEVTPKQHHQFITPAHEKIKVRILEPLRNAKKSYCNDEYVTAIALCGIVGETMAHVLYQLYETKIGEVVITSDIEESIFGRKFDELGQMRRIEVLSKLGYVAKDQEKILRDLQQTRRPYMHWWNLGKTTDKVRNDARQCVVDATRLFSSVFDIKLADAGSISIDGKVEAFLERVGEPVGPY